MYTSAVKRNRLKRQGRAIVHNLLANVSGSYSGIFFFKKGSESLTFTELEEEIKTLFTKTGILQQDKLK